MNRNFLCKIGDNNNEQNIALSVMQEGMLNPTYFGFWAPLAITIMKLFWEAEHLIPIKESEVFFVTLFWSVLGCPLRLLTGTEPLFFPPLYFSLLWNLSSYFSATFFSFISPNTLFFGYQIFPTYFLTTFIHIRASFITPFVNI